jgi:hypothetical protein
MNIFTFPVKFTSADCLPLFDVLNICHGRSIIQMCKKIIIEFFYRKRAEEEKHLDRSTRFANIAVLEIYCKLYVQGLTVIQIFA